MSGEELLAMSEEQKQQLIFEMGVTTKEKANYLSGRGAGMPAVKEAIRNINGIIHVDSVEGKGTTIKITLPKLYTKVEERISLTARDIETKNIIALNKITALISLNGTFNSIIMLSANEVMAKKMVQGFIIEDVKEEEVINYIEDVIGNFQILY